MKNYTLLMILFISINMNTPFARVPPGHEENNDTLMKVCLVHDKLYQVVPSSGNCLTSNAFYDLIEYNYDHNLYDFNSQDSFYLRFFDIAPDPRVHPEYYHGNYEVKAIVAHDPDCFEDESAF